MIQKGLNSDFIWVMIGIYTTAKLGLAKKSHQIYRIY